MSRSLVPAELLQRSDKILFVAHLALGDFTYMQNCFRTFAQAFPHIKMHLWVDELRRTSDPTQWEHLKRYSLYDWVHACSMFEKIYSETYSPQLFKQSIQQAQAEHYPIVVSFAVHHRHRYAKLMRQLSPDGFTVGQKKQVQLFEIHKLLMYRKLDAFIPAYKIIKQAHLDVPHISAIYANWFHQLFGITIPDSDRFPFVNIPERWQHYAKQQFCEWGFGSTAENTNEKVIFLNGFSKAKDRSWPLLRVFELASEMKKLPKWRTAKFIINVVPECMNEAKALHAQLQLDHIQLFSAEENFFQLPAVLSLCQLIISVETAVMHLANAVHVPVIALMRQTNPEWAPINAQITTVIQAAHPKDWIDEIQVERVLEVLP
jgi:heptosyltransferase-3